MLKFIKNEKAFTLIELLAVVVILGIILVIAVPRITTLINNIKINAFETDMKMILNAIRLKMASNEAFDYTIINEDNVNELLSIDNTNYKSLAVTEIEGEPYVVIVGQNRWNNLVVSGSYTNTFVQEGLVLWLKAGNSLSYPGEGDVWYDLSGYENNSTLLNGTTYNTENGGSIEFDGINSYVEVGSGAYFDILSKITFGALVKLYNSDELSYIISRNHSHPGNMRFALLIDQNKQIIPRYESSWNSGINIEEGEWVHLFFVYNNSHWKLYKNGILVAQRILSVNLSSRPNYKVLIGARHDYGEFNDFWNGLIKDVRIYNRALSAEEINILYESIKY